MKELVEKILERVEEKRDEAEKNMELSDVLSEANAYGGMFEGFDKEIGIVQKVAEEHNNGWIPCSERLPDIEADVLLTLRSLDIYTGFRANTDGYFYVEGTDDGYIPIENVIAWQPLPEPYKEEKNA